MVVGLIMSIVMAIAESVYCWYCHHYYHELPRTTPRVETCMYREWFDNGLVDLKPYPNLHFLTLYVQAVASQYVVQ